jgi:hypothetical protein
LGAGTSNVMTLTNNGAVADTYETSFTAVQPAGQARTYFLRYHENSTRRVRTGTLACFESGAVAIAHDSNMYCVAFPNQ